MKKLLVFFLLFLCSCTMRQDFVVLSYADRSLAVGHDRFSALGEDFTLKEDPQLEAGESLEMVRFYHEGTHCGHVSVINNYYVAQAATASIVKDIEIFPKDDLDLYQIDGIGLKYSVKESCDALGGHYADILQPACTLHKTAGDKTIIVSLTGDVLGRDRDRLYRIRIYVE